jgi:hypothetical protein
VPSTTSALAAITEISTENVALAADADHCKPPSALSCEFSLPYNAHTTGRPARRRHAEDEREARAKPTQPGPSSLPLPAIYGRGGAINAQAAALAAAAKLRAADDERRQAKRNNLADKLTVEAKAPRPEDWAAAGRAPHSRGRSWAVRCPATLIGRPTRWCCGDDPFRVLGDGTSRCRDIYAIVGDLVPMARHKGAASLRGNHYGRHHQRGSGDDRPSSDGIRSGVKYCEDSTNRSVCRSAGAAGGQPVIMRIRTRSRRTK